MSILLTAKRLGHAFGARPLFDSVSFTISDGDRIGLIGPNGAGKSTLLAILAGKLTPDHGELVPRAELRVSHLSQVPRFELDDTARDVVRRALAGQREGERPRELEWQAEAKLEETLSKLDLSGPRGEADTRVQNLSGGQQKRVALAAELALDPDLLLLDEPTNHLDVESIEWLERLLETSSFATVTITHDRYFLQRVSRRILELDRRNEDGLLDVAGDYATYLDRKQEILESQQKLEQSLRNTLRRETEWLRRGPAARTTKQTARIDRAKDLAQNVGELSSRNRTKRAEIELDATGRRSKLLIEAQGITKRFGDNQVFSEVDVLLGPGTRLALLGPNGAGKSTLLRVLIGRDEPTEGVVKRANDLQVQVFEQQRESLDLEMTVADTVAPGGDMIDFRGSRIHRFGYLERFLFRSEHMQMRVGRLSGGEQSRLLIARLMLKPADVLVLDEPTNDLDFDTLNVLEDALTKLDSGVLLVSHDRYFVDRVATQILAFHTAPGELGQVSAFADLTQWQVFHEGQESLRSSKAERQRNAASADGKTKRKKLSYKDQREFDGMEARIHGTEAKLASLRAESERPEVMSNAGRVLELHTEMDRLQGEIDAMFARWAELEAMLK
ncbi:MAG TPA: ABC-F family ATP-binding cassette domain-containing protein [Polyangiales bacterium]|nr:ABC-F family ATP-binding cassette domain-containing protein [Polyangiales bacterium]